MEGRQESKSWIDTEIDAVDENHENLDKAVLHLLPVRRPDTNCQDSDGALGGPSQTPDDRLPLFLFRQNRKSFSRSVILRPKNVILLQPRSHELFLFYDQ